VGLCGSVRSGIVGQCKSGIVWQCKEWDSGYIVKRVIRAQRKVRWLGQSQTVKVG
jgi:hypothetical protein